MINLLRYHLRPAPAAALLGVFLFCTLRAAGQAGTGSDLEPVRLQLKWTHQFQFAGYYAAVAKGYYAEAGFSVSLIEGHSERTAREAVLAGEAEYGVAGSELMLQYLEGDPVVALAAIFQHSPYALLALASSGIRAPADLAGKRIMLRRGATSTEVFAMLAQAGVDRPDFELVPHSRQQTDLLAGDVDAMSVYITEQPFFENRPDVETVLLRPAAFGVDFYGDCLFTTRARMQQHPAQVAAFRAASLRGWQYAMAHPGEIIAHIQQNYPGRRTDAELLDEARAMQGLILPELVPIGHMHLDRWARIAEIYRTLNLTKATRDLEGFVWQGAPGFPRALLKRILAVGGLIAVAVAGGAVALLYFNHRLKEAVRERTATLEALNAELKAESQRRGDAEEAFRKGEAYYRALLEHLPVGLALARLDGELLFVNEAYAQTIGRTVPETLGLHYNDITPAEYRDRDYEMRELLQRTGRFGPYEKEHLHRSGRRVPIRLSGILIERDGESFALVCVEDITGIREAEQALHFQEAQYRIVFESIPLGLIIFNADGTMADVNPAACQMHGYNREEFLALPPSAFIHADNLDDFGRFKALTLHGEEFQVSARDIRRDGTLINVDVIGVPFQHRGARQALGIVQDVTSRVEAEEALHASEEKFRTIVETSPEWIWEMDLAARHTYCNPIVERILGYTPEEFLKLDALELIHPEDQTHVEATLPDHIAQATGWQGWVVRWRHRDGSYRHLESNAAPIRDREGQLQGFRGVDRDITARVEAERLLTESMAELRDHREHLERLVRERTEALEQAQADLIRQERLATLGQIIGTVSHELRNPLGTIRSSVFSIGQMAAREQFERIGPALERAERGIVRCDRIIEELLDFTRPPVLDRQTTRLDSWLRETIADLSLDDRIACTWSLEADASVKIDREQFRRVVVNLTTNAVQAMTGGNGSGRTLHIGTKRTSGEVEVTIADEGEGIAATDLAKVYEPLFSTKGFGVGLGVPIVKGIVEAHDGRIRYESQVGQGTTVYIWLPTA